MLGTPHARDGNDGGLARILARRLTYLGGVTFSIEKIVGEPKRKFEALTIPRASAWRSLAVARHGPVWRRLRR
jgi:hypothetical protein